MRKEIRLTPIVVLGFIIIAGCGSCNGLRNKSLVDQEEITPLFTPGPHAIVYKTKKKYADLVPVILSADKKEIVSYPDPSDIHENELIPMPTKLKKGYWLDNRGINENVAFLKITYKEYAALDSVPSRKQLMEWVIDDDPIKEMCDCGNKTVFKEDIEEVLNDWIKSKKLKEKCKDMKP